MQLLSEGKMRAISLLTVCVCVCMREGEREQGMIFLKMLQKALSIADGSAARSCSRLAVKRGYSLVYASLISRFGKKIMFEKSFFKLGECLDDTQYQVFGEKPNLTVTLGF